MLSRVSLTLNHRLLLRTCPISQKLTNKLIHISCRGNIKSLTSIKYPSNKLSRYSPVFSYSFVRSISTDGTETINNVSSTTENLMSATSATQEIIENVPIDATPASLLDEIPDAPLVPVDTTADIIEPVVLATNKLGEATLESLGLGGWYPPGIIQHGLEFLHVNLNLPWWASIVLGTICIRTLIFPLVIISQRQAAVMHNVLPEMQRIQHNLTEARMCGDQLGAAKYTFELMEFMKEKKCNPLKNMIVPMCQAPVFISVFFGLKRMANLPVDSMRTGGLLWFTDLTVTDPYYLLPLMTSGTLYLTIKLGIEGPKLETMGMIKYVFQALPIFILPFIINFPAAITWYWLSTNLFSMVQVAVLKIPKVRIFFKIPLQTVHAEGSVQNKGFKQGFTDSMSNMKLARELGDRSRMDTIQFNRAGRGPVQKTYSYNPVLEHLKKEDKLPFKR